ncbi:hypothetical protein Esti_000383 [Eimeria stiedai]
MEEAAQKAMAAFAEGRPEAVQQVLGSLASPAVQYAVSRTQELGNQCFRSKDYRKALTHYSEAIAAYRHLAPRSAQKQEKQQQQQQQQHEDAVVIEKLQQLHSNRSACLAALNENEEALEAARQCIKLNPNWPKAWYRAGRALYGKGNYAGAVATFLMAQRKQQQQQQQQKQREADDSGLASWLAKSREALEQQKRRQRVSIDYSRFEDLGIHDDDEAIAAAAAGAVGEVASTPGLLEFASDTPEDQRRQIEALLTGKASPADAAAAAVAATAAVGSSASLATLLRFNPSRGLTTEPLQDFSAVYGQLAAAAPAAVAAAAAAAPSSQQQQSLLEAQIGVALCNYIQMGTDLREAQRCRHALNCPLAEAFYQGAQRLLKRETLQQQQRQQHCLFLGLGDCRALVAAAQLNSKHQQGSHEAQPPLSLTACPLFSSPAVLATYAAALKACGVAEDVRILPVSPYLLQQQPQLQREGQQQQEEKLEQQKQQGANAESPGGTGALSGAAETPRLASAGGSKKQKPVLLQQPFNCLLLDSVLFELGVLGRQLLPLVRHARSLCVPKPRIFPAVISVWIQAYEVRLPTVNPIGTGASSNSGEAAAAAATGAPAAAAAALGPFDLSPLEAAARWTPHVCPAALQQAPSEQTSTTTTAAAAAREDSEGAGKQMYGDVCTPRSKPKKVFSFRFDGPLANLDQDVPLEETVETVLESNGRPGIVNSLALWIEFFEASEASFTDPPLQSLFFSTAPAAHERATPAMPKKTAAAEAAAAAGERRHCGVRPVRQGLQWIVPAWLGDGQTLKVLASHSPTKMSLRSYIPRIVEGPSCRAVLAKGCAAGEQRVAVVPQQLDVARDPGLIRRLQEALQQQQKGQLRELEQAVRRRLRLLRTGGTALSSNPAQGPQLQLAGAVKSVRPLSMLCWGGDVLLPALTLQAATHAFYGAESFKDIRECGAPMPIKLLTAEPLAGSCHVAQKLLSLNATQILKAPQQHLPHADAAAKWRPIKELVEGVSAEPNENQQQQQQQGMDSSKATENESLLLKAKLKETAKIVQTNVFALLPAEGKLLFQCSSRAAAAETRSAEAGDTDALLAVAEAHRMQPGGDIKQQLQELLQQQEQQQQQQRGGFPGGLYRLQEAASLCVSLGLDNAGIGEGLVVYSRYAARALLTRRGAALLPSGLRVMGALLQLGAGDPSERGSDPGEGEAAAAPTAAAALAWVWHCAAAAAAADAGDYFEVCLQDEVFTLLSDPVELWKADCSERESGARRREETQSFSVKGEGTANCVALWFEFSLGNATVSTEPLAVRRILQQQQRGSSSPAPAAAELAPAEAGAAEIAAAEVAAAEAAAAEADVAEAAAAQAAAEVFESRMQQLWASLREAHTKASEAWVRLFHSPPDLSPNKALTPQPAQIFEAAAALAWGPGEQRSFFLDPFEASAVFRGLFY